MIACPTPTNIQVTGRKPMELPFSHQNRTVMLTALHSEHFWGLPTSLFILVCHSVTRRSTSSCYTSSERGLKYLSYYAKCLYIVLQISLYKHQSYSYPPRPRTIGEHGCFYYSIMRNGKEKKTANPLWYMVQGDPYGRGKDYVDIKFKVPSQAWVAGQPYS